MSKHTIVLTGQRHPRAQRRPVIWVDKKPIALQRNSFEGLCSLAQCYVESQQNWLRLGRTTICRLRQAIDQAIAPGLGMQLIETLGDSEYRLRSETLILQRTDDFTVSIIGNLIAEDVVIALQQLPTRKQLKYGRV